MLLQVLILTKSGRHARAAHEQRECTMGLSVPMIRLFATMNQPIQSILKCCSFTGAVNFMSWNNAYSIYPFSTFVQYKGYKLVGGRYQVVRDKLVYISLKMNSLPKGNFQGLIRLQEHPIKHPIRNYRRVGDEFTWTIPFDTKNVQWSEIPDQVLEYQSFQTFA